MTTASDSMTATENVNKQQRNDVAGAEADIWRRWMRAWGIVFYLALLLGLVVAFSEDFRGVDDRLLIAVLAAASAVWYGYFGGIRKLWARGTGWAIAYLVVEATLWLSLILLNPIFIFAGFGMLAHVCRLGAGWTYVVGAIIAGGMVLQEVTEQGPTNWGVLISASFLAGTMVIISRLVSDISQRSDRQRRLIAELETTRTELAVAEREAGTLAERHRLARDIHDTLAQGFTSIVMLLEAAEAELTADSPKTRSYIDQARSTARESLAEARGLVWALRSDRLIESSLIEALQSVVTQLSEETRTRGEFVVTGAKQDPFPTRQRSAFCVLARKHWRMSGSTQTLRESRSPCRISMTASYSTFVTTVSVSSRRLLRQLVMAWRVAPGYS